MWLNFCRKHHTQLCSISAGDPVQGFQLIDCNSDNRIITATRNMEYIALSYVWGPNASVDAVKNGTLIRNRLPQTVRDAIDVTKRLGYRYLWVDRHCIPTDSQTKHSQISQMDIIYKQAQATLLGASGDGADFGLPGAESRQRDEQPTAALGRHTLFSTLQHPKVKIWKSTWDSRGWAYQEAMLSTRRIFFTEEQVYWECRSMQCTEAHPPTLAD
ncbi:HET-domain-containing protein [Eremomyces bilateralis CBS 781.70]|uniref:HET-domain-containing protein n=1 Tax=Eremomyces bilateralis CBS 781.70 TaxID=1392243 RepID=A0A6G1G4C7_9PEZI|nr:HET-domain-containing protein [Eremomyces bilateralis CBS 781.70]KAF1812913.1 HET-domain-containing protein [Eremomyces bilateralis CBS 781.70]